MMHIDQLIRDRRRVRKQTQPSERIDALVGTEEVCGYAVAADAMKAVASGDEIADDLARCAAFNKIDASLVTLQIMQADGAGLVNGVLTRRCSRIHQIACDLSLAVDRHCTAHQCVEIDVMPDAAESDLGAVVSQSFLGDATTGSCLLQQRDCPWFDEPGADTSENVLAGLAFEDDIVDVVPVQKLTEQ